MKDITGTGHQYELANFEKKDAPGQVLQFIEKVPHPDAQFGCSGVMVTLNDGTTNEEVIAVLIDRCGKLHAKFPSRETALAITKLEEALMWLEKRTRDRVARGVEGKHLK